MTNVIITGGYFEHDDEVRQAFIKGYESYGARYVGNILVNNFGLGSIENAINCALTSNYDFVIQSTIGAQTTQTIANKYYPNVSVFMPAGSNNFEQVYTTSASSNSTALIVTASMTGNNDTNVTGYNTEFVDIDPLYGSKISSYSNGYIAGKIAYIKDYLSCSTYQARYIARQTASRKNSFTNINGYGRISIHDALNTYVNIPDDPFANLGSIGNISIGRNESTIGVTIDAVTNAIAYKIYRNDVLIYEGTSTTYSDTVSPTGIFNYKYKAYNRKAETEFSKTAQIVYQAYQQIYYK